MSRHRSFEFGQQQRNWMEGRVAANGENEVWGYSSVQGSAGPRDCMMVTHKSLRLLTVAEYMNTNIPGHTELIGGLVYDVSPKNPPHTRAVRFLTKALSRGLSDAYILQVQDPIAVDGWTGKYAPEIDLAVIDAKEYLTTPTARDSRAFIEVSDTTYREDREEKIPLYVKVGVATWHINIPSRQVEYYAAGTQLALVIGEHETIHILGVSIAVSDIFAPLETR